LRLTRIGKLMSYIPELMILVKGMVEGMRSVSLTMLLLFIIIYVVAVALTQVSRDSDLGDAYFKTVPAAMYTLLIFGMVPDIGDVMDDLKQEWYLAIIFVVFVFFSTFTILNMLIGILCEVVSDVKSTEKEIMDIQWLKSTIKRVMIEEIDADHDGLVSKLEFLSILEKPVALSALVKLGFDVVALVDFADILFPEEGESNDPDHPNKNQDLTFDEFISVLLQSRSTMPATQKDLRELQKSIVQKLDPVVQNRSSVMRSKTEALLAASEEQTRSLTQPTDNATIVESLNELRTRVDSIAQSQPALLERMSSMERLVESVAENQKQLMDRLPSLDVLRKLTDASLLPPAQPVGFAITPGNSGRITPPRQRADMRSQNQRLLPNKRTLPPAMDCVGVLCCGPAPPPMPANAMRGFEQIRINSGQGN